MLNMLATLAEYERELIVGRVKAGITAARGAGTVFGRPPTDPALTAEKLQIIAKARAEGDYTWRSTAKMGIGKLRPLRPLARP